jgi:hypothetical protein
MPLTLDSTVAAETSNSYVNVAYCDDYWNQHYSATKAAQWSALTNSRKESLLIQACRVIEGFRFTYSVDVYRAPSYQLNRLSGLVVEFPDFTRPTKYDRYQALQFPRNIDRDKDDGTLIIPEAVKMAQCEQAVHILNFDESLLSSQMNGVESESFAVGTVRISQTFRSGSGGGSVIAPMAAEFLRPYFIRTSKAVRRG